MLTFDCETHEYRWCNTPVVSTTQVFSRVAVRNHDDAPFRPIGGIYTGKETASQFGKAMHKIAELTVQGKDFSYDPQMQPWINGLNKFLNDCGKDIEFNNIEVMAYSKLYQYAGTWDVAGSYKGKPLILDWKTASQKSKTWGMQTAAYEQLAKEHYSKKNDYVRMVVMIKENNYEVIVYKDKLDFNCFLSLLNVYKKFF